MRTCCICGKKTDSDAGIRLPDNTAGVVCLECDNLLAVIETEGQTRNNVEKAYASLGKKMTAYGADEAVFSTVYDTYAGRLAADQKAYEGAETYRESDSRELVRLANGLIYTALVLFSVLLVAWVIFSFFVMDKLGPAIGIGMLAGGVLVIGLLGAMTILLARTAAEIGQISGKLDKQNLQTGRLIKLLKK